MFFRKIFVFLQKDFLEAFSYKSAIFFTSLTMISHLVTFFFVAKLMGNLADGYLKPYGAGYFPFVLIGIAFSGFALSVMGSISGAVLKEQGTGTLEAILLTPTSLWTVIFAGSFSTIVLGLIQMGAYLAIGALLLNVDLSRLNLFSFAFMIFLSIAGLSGLGLISAGFSLVFKRGDPVSYFFNAASRFLSGVYFPISILPGWVQKISYIFPTTYSLEGFRKAAFLGAPPVALQNEMLALLLFAAIFLPVGILYFQWALRQAKKDGSLAFV